MNMTAGQRYVESAAYRAAQASGTLGSRVPVELTDPVEVLSADELRAQLHLRTFSDLTSFSIEGEPFPGLLPTTAPLPSYVETIPVNGLQIELAAEASENELATAVPDGVPYPEASIAFPNAATLQKLPRVGIAWPVSLGVLDEPGQVQSLLNRRLNTGVGLGIENDLINGNAFWGGALAAVTQTVAKGAGYRADAIVNAIAAVQAKGWYTRPLQVVINPATRAAVYTERDGQQRPIDVSGMLDDLVEAWVITNKIPPGMAIVGDWFGAFALFTRGGLTAAVSTEHVDFFTRGLAEMSLGFRAFAWLREPSALCLVTGIS